MPYDQPQGRQIRPKPTNFFLNDGKLRIFRVILLPILLVSIMFVMACGVQTVPAGHEAVGTSFGKIQDDTLGEGIHFTSPFTKWQVFDCRQKTLDIPNISVPSMDQLSSAIDFSIQYRVICSLAASMLRETGTPDQVVAVHFVPRFRSLVRERSKSVPEAEGWFTEEVQQDIQSTVLEALAEFLAPKGINVTAVLIRDVRLPKVITDAITRKKERQQQEELQQAELARFQIEAQQVVATAQASKDAAVIEGETLVLLAEANAKANRTLSASLNANILASRRLDIEAEKVVALKDKWNGNLPPSVIPYMEMQPLGGG